MRRSKGKAREWVKICLVEELPVDRGVIILAHGQAIAVFRTADDQVYALGNHEPYGRSAAIKGVKGIAGGIVGSRAGVPFVALPRNRRAFDLRTGRCLEDHSVRVPAYDTKTVDGYVHVGPRLIGD